MSSLCRRAGVAAAPILVACIVALLSLAAPVQAQSEVTRAELEKALAQIDELKARLEKLEGGGDGVTLVAPLTVVGASGQTILTVDEEGGRPRLVVGTPDSRGIELVAGSQSGPQTESGTGIVVKDGSKEIELTIESQGVTLKLQDGGGSEVTLGALKGGASGLAVSLNDSEVVVARSLGPGAGEIVVGGDEGQQATLSGSADEGSLEIGREEGLRARLSVEQETAELLLGSDGGAEARLTQDSDGGELLLGKKEGEQVRLTQDSEGGELVLGKDQGKQARLALSADGGELLLGEESGKLVRLAQTAEGGELAVGTAAEPLVLLTALADGGELTLGKAGGKHLALSQKGEQGEITLGSSGTPDVTLGTTAEGGELLFGAENATDVKLASNANGGELLLGKADGTRVQMGTTGGDSAIVLVGAASKRAWIETSGDMTGAASTTEQGAAQLGLTKTGWGLVLSKQNAMQALLGSQSGQPIALKLFSGSEATVNLQAKADGGELTMGKGSEKALKLSSNAIISELLLGKESGKHARVLADGQHATLAATDGDKEAWLEAGGATGAFVTTTDGEVELGNGLQGWGLVLTMSGQLSAGLSTLEGRGLALRLYDQGSMVAAMGPNPDGDGGTVRVFAGGSAAASLDAVSGSGVVTAYRSDGTAAAALDAGAQTVAVYNSGGNAIATLSTSSHGSGGNVSARNDSGEGVFSAGAASDGGGEACVFRDTQNTFCLGMGLPGMGIGK